MWTDLMSLQILPQLAQYGWAAAFAAAIFALLALLKPMKKSIKYHIEPRLQTQFTYSNRDEDSIQEYCRKTVEADTAIVPLMEEIQLGIAINSDWIYTPLMVEISGDGEFPIKQDHIFTEDDRPWENPYSDSDLHGNYKVQIDGLRIAPGHTLVFDVCLPKPIMEGEERQLTVMVMVKESKKSFEQNLWVRAADNSAE